MRDDEVRLAVSVVDRMERIKNLLTRVAIDFNDIPAERCPAFLYGINLHDILCVTGNLKMIAVNDCHKIIQLVVRACHGSLIYRAFTLLAVAIMT